MAKLADVTLCFERADLKIITIAPGMRTSHHFHLERESIFHICSGKIRLRSDHASINEELRIGDTVIVDLGEDHVFENVGTDDAIMLEIESPPHSSADQILTGKRPGDVEPLKRNAGRLWAKTSRSKLKICGIKSLDAALECLRLGVAAVGIHAIKAGGIRWALENSFWISRIPEELSVVVLTDAEDAGTLSQLIRRTSCDTVQIQGDHTELCLEIIAEAAASAGIKKIKTIGAAVGTNEEEFLAQLTVAQRFADAVLIDNGRYGGTGQVHNWELTKKLRKHITKPLIVAGGIGPDNCASVLAELCPDALDVESKAEWRIPLPGGKRLTAKNFGAVEEIMRQLT